MKAHRNFWMTRWKVGTLMTSLLVCPMANPITLAKDATLAKSNQTSAIDSLRWNLEETEWDFGIPIPEVIEASPKALSSLIESSKRSGSGPNLHRTAEALLLKGDEASIQRAREIISRLIEIHGSVDVNAVVTPHGIEYMGITKRQESGGKVYEAEPENTQRPTVLNVKDLGYEYAMLYLLSGDPSHAAKARDILLRFAEVIPSWPLYDRENKPHSQDEVAYLRKGVANGIWSVWNPLDLGVSLPLLRAYDIIRPTLTPEQQTTIEENFFVHQKKLSDRFQHYRLASGIYYNNLQGYRLIPQIRFGLVLNRPDFIHESVALTRGLMRHAYTADGIWKELTPGYHFQVSSRVMLMVPKSLKGYSDPEGYVNPTDGTRFDNLDLEKMFAPEFHQMQQGINVLAMPDGTYASVNDDWPKSKKVPLESRSFQDKPGLLGVAGVAKLGAKQTVAFLQFDGTRGHDHLDGLNLLWFAGGREVFSDTGYQALPQSGSTREWHTIGASHNTVVVDETNHFLNRDRLTVPQSDGASTEEKLTAVLPEAAKVANQGRLLLWHAESEKAQAMEAEQETAYPGVTSLFHRTVVMIPEGNGDSTLVDIFRIRGGKLHDFLLRGGLDEAYSMTFNAALQPVEKTVHSYIQVKESAEIRPPLLATVRYPDGYMVRSHLGGVFGSPNARLELMVGEAHAIRRLGKAPFSVVRNQLDSAGTDLETCFVWVHEAGRQERVRNVKVEAEGANITVIIEREGQTEWIFSGADDEARFRVGKWAFEGRLAYASQVGEESSGLVFSGEELLNGKEPVAAACRFATGEVVETSRREAGAEADTLLLKLNRELTPDDGEPRLVHIDFGPQARFSIPVIKAAREGDRLRLTLVHSPGFNAEKEGAKMTQYPGWGYSGAATVRLEFRPQTQTK